jgi:hypothetical protein
MAKKLSYSNFWSELKSTNYVPTKTSDTEGRKICIYLPINRKHKVVKLPTYQPDGRNQLQASENEFMTSAHKDEWQRVDAPVFGAVR